MRIRDLLDKQSVCLNAAPVSKEAAITTLADFMAKSGCLSDVDSYREAVFERERKSSTGLGEGIAIPHASPENNVLKNGIAAISLVKPVKFHSMENPDSEIDVDMVFMLALASSTDHLDVLKKLFVAFQNQSLVNALKHSTDKAEFLKLLTNNLI